MMNPVMDLVQQAKAQGQELGYRQCFDDMIESINDLCENKEPVHGPSLATLIQKMDEYFKIRQLTGFEIAGDIARIFKENNV